MYWENRSFILDIVLTKSYKEILEESGSYINVKDKEFRKKPDKIITII